MRSYVILVLVILFIAAAAWVGVSIYDSANSSDVNPNAQQYLTPIEPTFDKETIDSIGERIDALQVKAKVFIDLESTATTGETETSAGTSDSE